MALPRGRTQQAVAAQRLQRSRNRLHRGNMRRAEACTRHAAGLERLDQPRLEHLLVRCRGRAKRWPCARAAVAARRRAQDGTAGESWCTACACTCQIPLLQQTAETLTETAASSASSASAQTLDWRTGTRAHGLVAHLAAAHPAPGWSKAVIPAALGRRYSTGVASPRHPSGEALGPTGGPDQAGGPLVGRMGGIASQNTLSVLAHTPSPKLRRTTRRRYCPLTRSPPSASMVRPPAAACTVSPRSRSSTQLAAGEGATTCGSARATERLGGGEGG